MADGITLNPGTGGSTLATDDTSAGHIQYIKLAYSADGDATPVTADANGVLVNLGSNNDVTITSGTVTIGTALPAGTNGIGKLTANSGVDIGDVDVTSVTPGSAAANLGKGEDAAHSSGDVGVMALAVRADTATASGADGDYVPLLTDSAGRLHVNVGTTVTVAAHAVTNAGTFAVQVDGNALTSLQLIDDTVFTDDAAFTPGTSKVLGIGCTADESSTDSVDEGDIGITRMTLDRKKIVTPYVHAAAGGHTPYKNLDCDESEDEIKGSAGKLFWIHAMNLSNAKRYLKFYNDTAANVSVGTTVPVLTFPVPTHADTNGAGFTIHFGDAGVQFSAAITVAATTGFADNDTGAPGANEVILNAGYL